MLRVFFEAKAPRAMARNTEKEKFLRMQNQIMVCKSEGDVVVLRSRLLDLGFKGNPRKRHYKEEA